MRREREAANEELADAEAARWRLRQREGLDEAGRAELAAWLDASGERRRAYAAHARVDALLSEMSGEQRRRLAVPPPSRLRRHGLAACAALLLACTLGWHWRAGQPQWTQTLASARGQQLERVMADGSRLSLDVDTVVEVAYFKDRRETKLLRGQAMFSVAPDAGRPFRVAAGPVRVTVLGTRFAARHLYGAVEVGVEHGKVAVADHGDAEAAAGTGGEARSKLLLTDGQRAVWRDGSLRPEVAVPPETVAAWRTGRLAFSDRPLAEVLAEFERYGPTGLKLARPDLGALRLSGSFASHDAAAFARILPRVLPVALRKRGGETLIDARK
ncbi:FecR family protein [Chromobacterium piscinae]|uniref:FecR family protein n=1 Tax=Chromobacterium piscinae TaxID=686831 RepID=UPI001E34D9DF|nr:FecR domain-containing protein [Chromobacterium piscinae]MCD5328113.1 FecR domain-containing protein [Chromobacterium piscinae]